MNNRKFDDKKEPEIVYSRSIKAGKRIYYLDVKKARNEDLYLCITESKRLQGMEDELPQFEKHKLFLYKEDFAHFTEGLQDVINYVKAQMGDIEDREEWTPQEGGNSETSMTATEEEIFGKDTEEKIEEKQVEEKKPRRGLFGLGRK